LARVLQLVERKIRKRVLNNSHDAEDASFT
jgi:hypothetical protein